MQLDFLYMMLIQMKFKNLNCGLKPVLVYDPRSVIRAT